MKTTKTSPQSTNNVQLSSTTPMASPQNYAEELEKIMLKMIYRISQEDSHDLANAGNVA